MKQRWQSNRDNFEIDEFSRFIMRFSECMVQQESDALVNSGNIGFSETDYAYSDCEQPLIERIGLRVNQAAFLDRGSRITLNITSRLTAQPLKSNSAL